MTFPVFQALLVLFSIHCTYMIICVYDYVPVWVVQSEKYTATIPTKYTTHPHKHNTQHP